MLAEQTLDEDELADSPTDWLDSSFRNIAEIIRQRDMRMGAPDRAKPAKEVVHSTLLLDRRSVPRRAVATTYADFFPTASASTLVTKAFRETPSRAAMIFSFSCRLRGAR
jgi:hypothetical protein